jgi:hypothetical protein
MRKLLITLSGKGGEVCGGVLSDELTKALHKKKATILEEGIEYKDETIFWSEIDNFAHVFGPYVTAGTVNIVDGKKKHEIKAKEHTKLDMTWCGWPSSNQYNSGKNTIIITNQIQDGDFGCYYLELADDEAFDPNKLFIGYISFDEFGIEDYDFVVDLFYGEIETKEFESFVEQYVVVKNAVEREEFCKKNLPKGVVNIKDNFEDDFSTENYGTMIFEFECKVDSSGELEEEFTLKNKYSM